MPIHKTCTWLVQAGGMAVGLAVATAAFATVNPQCGDSGPACDGECPAGQRCISSAVSISVSTIFPPHGTPQQPAEQGSEQEGCRCAEVRCGGELLEEDEGCCNGHKYTLGVLGCCAGIVVPVNEPCSCTDDLGTQACCFLRIEGVGSTTIIYDPHQSACCQRIVVVDGFQGILQTGYSFSTGFDCCGGPTEASFCPGACQGAACVASGCCVCSSCELGNDDHCVAADTPDGCNTQCFLDTCDGDRLVQGGVCGVGASACGAVAPAASRWSLVLLVGVLGAIALIRLAQRTRTSAS